MDEADRIEKVRIKMKQTKPGSPNGRKVEIYLKDNEYEIPKSLADVFIDNGLAEEVTVAASSAPEVKDSGHAPDNKSLGGAPDNKGAEDGGKDKDKSKDASGNKGGGKR